MFVDGQDLSESAFGKCSAVNIEETSHRLRIQAVTQFQPRQLPKQDYEYERKGTTNLFIFFEPLTGKRYTQTSTHRTAFDWAQVMKTLSDELYPEAEIIVLAMDNLNMHKLASFYEVFEPQEAHRLSREGSKFTKRPSKVVGSTWPKSS